MSERYIKIGRSWVDKTSNLYNPIDELVDIMKKRLLNDPRLRHFNAEERIIVEREIKREAVNMGKRLTKMTMSLYFHQKNKGDIKNE